MVKKPLSFNNYLALQQNRRDDVGRFAKYWGMIPVKSKPRGCQHWPKLALYLEEQKVMPSLLRAAQLAWSEWKTSDP